MLHTLRRAGFLSAFFCLSFHGIAQTNLTVVQQYVREHASGLGLKSGDQTTVEIMSEAPSKSPGVTHVYVRQLINGIPVTNGLATITIKDGNVVHISSRLKNVTVTADALPSLTAQAALEKALEQLGVASSEPINVISASANNREVILSKGHFSREDVPAKLVYLADDAGNLQLTWDMSVALKNGENWWSMRVDAHTGIILEKNDWISHCAFDNCSDPQHQHETAAAATQTVLMPPPPGLDQYFVYALPVESPNHGDRSMVINPSDASASPFGWHDDNGVIGDEYTITRGNNVYASDDIDDDDFPGYSPDGGALNDFNFPYDSLVGVQGNLDAVITNLFYMNNMMHDIWYQYGFDEPSGNFQSMNYTGDGLGNDLVFADAQDGSGTNNANFGTPPEGESPRMQMYLWTEANVPDLLTVNDPAGIAGSYVASTAGFGPPVSATPITADFVLVDDGTGTATDGCDPILNGAEMAGKIVLVRRGGCTFASKVEAIQEFGAVAVIVMNNQGGAPTAMGGNSATAAIPAIMISQTNGNTFETMLSGGTTINGTIVAPNDLTATDSDFDNMIIAHEYGHGISTRLTGGAENSDCLNNAEQMGEGWSDWFGLMITIEPGDQGTDRRGVGTYVSNQPVTGNGIRPAPYSTDPSINGYTYSATNNTNAISEPHGIGFVWASMLWDLNWALIDEYGFDPDVKYGTGGNNIAMALVIEGLKLQPCGPGFVDGRDAILLADELLYAGANKCLIWEVFANRGLGYSADQGNADDRTDQNQAFDVHPSCLPNAGIEENTFDYVSVYPNPAKDVLFVDLTKRADITALRIVDVQGKVLTEMANLTPSVIDIHVGGFKNGIYFLELIATDGTKSIRVVKH
ncbi:MAG TPA: T9SS-dependent M36 family metallopeptidase [Fluviicola sp.]|nr:T9SS-dependent M36 family metallopeptidase [Fluviicola sp.]